MNFLETFAPVSAMAAITAINQPTYAASCFFVIALGRSIYGLGYCNCGPAGRLVGAIIFDLALLALLGGAIWSLASWKSGQASVDLRGTRIIPVSYEKFQQLYVN